MIFLTEHAGVRVRQRTKLDPEEVKRLVNLPDPQFVGYQPDDNRVHILLYSVPDSAHFVAAVNLRTKAVATVITLAQYQLRYGCIDDGRLRSAMVDAGVRDIGTGLIVRVRHYTADGKLKTRNFGRWSGVTLKRSPDSLASDASLRPLLKAKCAELGICYDSLYDVTVRLREKDIPVLLPMRLGGMVPATAGQSQSSTSRPADGCLEGRGLTGAESSKETLCNQGLL